MTQRIRIKMLDKEIKMDSPDNIIFKSSVTTAFLLPDDAVVSLSYEVDGGLIYCRMNETGTTYFLPDGWGDLQFFANTNRAPSRSSTALFNNSYGFLSRSYDIYKE